jgi:DNA-binding NarL/FixJ family response regulator
LSRSVGGDDNLRVAGTAATFPFLRSLISEVPADLAIIDLPSGAWSGTTGDWLAELLDLVAVLMLIPEPQPAIVNRILNQKTGGVLPADASPEQLTQAIKSVASGLMIFDGSLLNHGLRGSSEEPAEAAAEPLTPRESEVLGLLADGLGNKEIAAAMNISEHTIKFHIRSILGKLGASSRTEAVTRGFRSGIIEL